MSKLSILSIVVGSAALLVVLSGFNGLKDYTLAFSSQIDPDLKIISSASKSFRISKSQLSKAMSDKNILSYTKTVEEKVLLSTNNTSQIITLKGVDENYSKTTIDSILFDGDWCNSSESQIVSGWGLASKMSFGNYDYNNPLFLYAPKPGKKQIFSESDAFRKLRVINTGLFEINEDYDFSFAYTNITNAQKILNYEESQFSSIEVLLKDVTNIYSTTSFLQKSLGSDFEILNKSQLNKSLYKMLNTEQLAVYLIFSLVLIVALFNLISSIIMMIIEKQSNLKTLSNLGLSVSEIKKIFFYQGLLTTIGGGLLGVIFGFLLILLQKKFSLLMITPTLAYPVSLTFSTFFIVITTVFVLGGLSSKIASNAVSKKLLSNS